MEKKKMSGLYLGVYIVVVIISLGTVWFAKNLIVHAIHDAKKLE